MYCLYRRGHLYLGNTVRQAQERPKHCVKVHEAMMESLRSKPPGALVVRGDSCGGARWMGDGVG